MIALDANNTAVLALVVSWALRATGPAKAPSKALDPKTALELAVLARVLEKRLSELRRSLLIAPSPATNQARTSNGRLVGPGHASTHTTRPALVSGA